MTASGRSMLIWLCRRPPGRAVHRAKQPARTGPARGTCSARSCPAGGPGRPHTGEQAAAREGTRTGAQRP